ncbi:tetratricopeptide repeat protein [uncultured Nostoc sp.]|uniref:tetratricopeptide repeat protein n=1 Tax=uncultured Nostoc sp. TaxID=340711 RepID=UPI00260AEE0C|nr:tetratricopeptide repeat protein [uncultured Nostoc sp.]
MNQGFDKQKKGDLQGAIAAYTEAIRLNPNFAQAYTNRGVVRADLGDNKGAITDLQQAADIFKQQGKIEDAQKLLEIINQLQK